MLRPVLGSEGDQAPNPSTKDKAKDNLYQESWHAEHKSFFSPSCRGG